MNITSTPVPTFVAGSSIISSAGSSNIYFSSSGNIGIGTSNPQPKMTINTNGSVTLGNPYPSYGLEVQSEKIKALRVKFMDLLRETILEGSIIDGDFMNDMIEIFDTCGGWNVDTVDDFRKMADLFSGRKISRNIISQFNDVIMDRIINTWGFDLSDAGEIFEKIELDQNI
jgi:hypothetical protein